MWGQGNARLPAGMAGIIQAKKAIYLLNMEGFWPVDNYRIIAASDILIGIAIETNLAPHSPFLGGVK